MDKKIFEVEIGSGGPESYKTATVLTMPCTQAEFRDALQKARIQDIRMCSNELTKISYPSITSGMIGQNVDLLELNLLVTRLTMLDEDDRMGLDGLLQMERESRGSPIPLSHLINLTFNVDICLLAPQVSNLQELGALLYEGEMLSEEAVALLDTTEPDSWFRNALLRVFGQKHQEDFDGVFTSCGCMEPGVGFKVVYQKGEMFCFTRSSVPVVLEVSKGFFDDPNYDNSKTSILILPAIDADIWQVVGEVDAASVDECAFRCIDCEIPALRDAINDAIDEEGGIEQVNEFARLLAQKTRIWDINEIIKYKALLSAAGHPSLQDAMQLMHGLDQYELRPEVAATWDYAELILREKYPDLPEELFQTPQAARVGQRMLGEGNAVITDYGLLRRTELGEIEENLWCQLTEAVIHAKGEEKLFACLVQWEAEHNYTESPPGEVRKTALQLHAAHIFDNPGWVHFVPFTRRYQPEVLETAHLVSVVNDCCQEPGLVTQE